MSTLVDWNGNKSRYLHVECINGGLHPLDTVSHTTPLSQAQADEISMIRAPPEAVDPVLPYARCPRTVREAAAVQGPEWWTRLAWDDMRKLHGLTLVDVPRACRAKYADLVVAAIADVEAAAPAMLAGDSRAREQAWMKLCLVDVMVLNSTRSPGESQTMAVNRRIRNFQGEQWEALWQEATRLQARPQAADLPMEERERRVAAKVEGLALAGQAKRAARAAMVKSPPVTDPAREQDLKNLFPAARPRTRAQGTPAPFERDLPPEWLTPQGLARTQQIQDLVEAEIRNPVRLKAPGPMGTRPEHLEVLKFSEDGVRRMANLITRLALGQEPKAVVRAHSTGSILAMPKPDGGIRPVIFHSLHRRIGLGAVAATLKADAEAAAGPHQLGGGSRDGCVKAFHATAALTDLHATKPVMACDVGAAHQSLDRAWMMQEVRQLCPAMERPLAVWYPQDSSTTHWWRTSRGDVVDVPAESGLDQGCPLASPTYCISVARPAERALEAIRRDDPSAQLLLYADDTQLQTELGNLSRAHEAISEEWGRAGLGLNPTKTKVFVRDAAFDLGEWQGKRVATLKCLGANLTDDGVAWEGPSQGGSPAEELERSAVKLQALAARLRQLQDHGLSVQLAQSLLRYAAVGSPQHILMCKAITPDQAARHDESVREAWQTVLGLEMTDDTWERATYPLKMGGLAPGTVGGRASAAYLTALSRTMPEVLKRTGCDSVEGLRQAVPSVDQGIKVASDDLTARGVSADGLPFTRGVGTVPPRQKDIMTAINAKRYEDRLETLDHAGRGQLRSASGPGAAAFLQMPTQQEHRIEDPLFRVAVVRRLGGRVALRAGVAAAGHCSLVGRDGAVCGHPLDRDGLHVNQCKKGGHVIRRHDRVVKWLSEWIGDRVETEVLLEQAVPTDGEEEGRLDLTLESGGRRLWLDVAVVNVATANVAERLRRAKMDGAAARHEEGSKRSKYRGLATPFVVEAHGRPGDVARSILGRFAVDQGRGVSADVAEAWQSLSAIVQAESAALELRSCGFGPADWGTAGYYM